MTSQIVALLQCRSVALFAGPTKTGHPTLLFCWLRFYSLHIDWWKSSLGCQSLHFHPCISQSLRFRIPAISIPAFSSLQTLIPAFFNPCILQNHGNLRWDKFKLWVFLTFKFNIIRSHKLIHFLAVIILCKD